MRTNRALHVTRLLAAATTAVLALMAAGCESSSSVSTGPDPAKCGLTLSTPAALAAAGGTSTVSVTAQPECAWTVSTQANWITDLSPSSGQGNGSFAFRAAANPAASRREAEIVVNDSRVRVAQDAAPCLLEISPASQSVPASGATGTITVTVLSGCAWTAATTDSWITITSNASGNGNGTVSYRVDANDNAGGRSGSISIGNRSFRITQDGQSGPPPSPNCTYSLGASSQNFSAAGGPGSVTVSAPPGCAWAVTNSASWITLTSAATGTSNGTVTFTVAANTGAGRNAALTIAGQTYTVTQDGASPPACSPSINPTSANAVAGGATGTVTVTNGATCQWTAVSNAPTWLTVTSGASVTGPGSVTYSVAANTDTAQRTGTITIAGQTFTVTQDGASAPACTYAINPTSATPSSAATTGSVNVTAGSGCAWTATSNAGWLMVTSGSPGTSNGTVGYSVAQNTDTSPRTGTITIAGQTFTVTQDAAPTCTYSLTPNPVNVGVTGGVVSITVATQAGCAWTASESESWITIDSGASGTGPGTIVISISINTLLVPRSGTITFSGQGAAAQSIVVNQGIL